MLPRRLSKWQAINLFSDDGESCLLKALCTKPKSLALLPGA